VLTDFYDVECLSKAKLPLMEDIDKLHLSTKRPHVAQRRDGDGRLAKEVGDILVLLQFVDEHKLPTYVASSPDTMPSLRLYDGDMKMMAKNYYKTCMTICLNMGQWSRPFVLRSKVYNR